MLSFMVRIHIGYSLHSWAFLPATLVVQLQQLVHCMCVSVCVWTITYEINDLSPGYLVWFTLMLTALCSKVDVLGQN